MMSRLRNLEQAGNQPVGRKKYRERSQEAQHAVEKRAEPEGFGETPAVADRMIFGQILDRAVVQIDIENREIADHRTDDRDDAVTFSAERADDDRHAGEGGDGGQ